MSETAKTTDLPLIQHLNDLRKALLRAALAFVIGCSSCLYYSKELYDLLAAPLVRVLPDKSHFITTHPFEAWMTYFKTSLIAGFFVALPFILWPIWNFIAPGLIDKERKYSLFFVLAMSVLFIAGALFGYIVVFPAAFEFFVSITDNTDIVFMPQMQDYLSFAFRMLLAFGLIFELPIAIIVLALSGLVSIQKLVATQKYMIVMCFVVAAVLTPPDVISQCFMALPMIVLYELGLLIAWLFTRSRTTENLKNESAANAP